MDHMTTDYFCHIYVRKNNQSLLAYREICSLSLANYARFCSASLAEIVMFCHLEKMPFLIGQPWMILSSTVRHRTSTKTDFILLGFSGGCGLLVKVFDFFFLFTNKNIHFIQLYNDVMWKLVKECEGSAGQPEEQPVHKHINVLLQQGKWWPHKHGIQQENWWLWHKDPAAEEAWSRGEKVREEIGTSYVNKELEYVH